MGNTFTYYQGDNNFNISTTDDNGVYALVILDSNLSLADVTVNDFWVASEFQTGTGPDTYNLLFRYEPEGVPTVGYFNNRIVFTADTSDLDPDLEVQWVIDTSNTGDASTTPVFNEPFNQVTMSTEAGSGGEDPHIIPLYNPAHKVYLLPTDDKTYRYFDTQESENLRLIINARMWIISNPYIERLEKLIKNNKIEEYHRQRKNIEFPTELSPLETSFMRYIDFYGLDRRTLKQYKLTFDMEDLSYEGSLPNVTVSPLRVTKKSIYYPGTKNVAPNKEYDKHRVLTVKTENYGTIYFYLYLTPMRPNHRNHIEIVTNRVKKIIDNCYGCLVNIKQVSTCQNIETSDKLKPYTEIRTLDEYRQTARNYRRRILRQQRRRKKN